MEGVLSVCNAVRSYDDGAPHALLILGGASEETYATVAGVLEWMGARTEDPEVTLPFDLPFTGVCIIRPDSVTVECEYLGFEKSWGETSAWWTDVTLTDGCVYLGLSKQDLVQSVNRMRLDLTEENWHRLYTSPLPKMPFVRLSVRVK